MPDLLAHGVSFMRGWSHVEPIPTSKSAVVKPHVLFAGLGYAMRGVFLSLCFGTGLAVAHQADGGAKRNLRSGKTTTSEAFQVIGLSRKPSASPLVRCCHHESLISTNTHELRPVHCLHFQRTTFGNKRLYHFSANDGTPDKAGAEVLTQFIPELPAYFAQLEFKGQVGLPTIGIS